MKDQYIQALSERLTFPIALKKMTKVSCKRNNSRVKKLIAEVCRLAQAVGVNPILVGSASSLLCLAAHFKRHIHDVDFVIPERSVSKVRDVLLKKGYYFWNENYIHRHARNLTGGFGRHHNYGACSNRYLSEAKVPIWIGFFTYKCPHQNEIIFDEYYAISKFKINQVVSKSIKERHFQTVVADKLFFEIQKPLRKSSIKRMIKLLFSEGVDFWQVINHEAINEEDIEKRREHKFDYKEQFTEVRMIQKYNVSPEAYFNMRNILLEGVEVSCISIESTYLRMSRFFPHYLGARDKYLLSASLIEKFGKLGKELENCTKIYENRCVQHKVQGVFTFTKDLTQDSKYLRKMDKYLNRDRINYWALLLEGVHYTVN